MMIVHIACSIREANMLRRAKKTIVSVGSLVSLLLLVTCPHTFGADRATPTSASSALILHSYHHGFSWTDDISEGIRSVFATAAPGVDIHFEFMDSRRVHTEEYFHQLSKTLAVKLQQHDVGVVICCDDNALRFMLDPQTSFLPGVPLVFCSVTGYEPAMRKGRELTGLLELIDIRGTLNAALALHPNTREVAVITDSTRTGRALKSKGEAVFKEYDSLQFRYLENLPLEELQAEVAKLTKGTIVLLFVCGPDAQGHIFSPEQNVARISPSCRVPIYSMWDVYLGHGIVGGSLTSGYAEGRAVADIAVRVLRGEKASAIPLGTSPSHLQFDYRQMRRFGLRPSDLPAGATIVNRQFSLYDRYRMLFWATGLIMLILVTSIAALTVNIRRRRRTEADLRHSQERYRDLVENINDVIYIVEASGIVSYVSPAVELLLGYTPDEICGRTFLAFVHPDDAIKMQDNRARLRTGTPIVNEYRLLTKKGDIRWVRTSSRTVIEKDRVVGLQGILTDITSRKEAESALRESEQKYRMLFDAESDAILLADAETLRVLDANTAACILYGYSHAELLRLTVLDLSSEPQASQDSIQKALAKGTHRTAICQHKKKDGTAVRVEISAASFDLGGRRVICAIFRDITERILMEERLRQTQKMEAIGELAGGVAHDFNNALTPIIGNAEMLLDTLSPDSEEAGLLKDIVTASQRAASLTRQLLSFARKGSLQKEPVDMHSLINEANTLLGRSIDRNIELRTILAAEKTIVTGDPTQLQTSLLNLGLNARDAMPQGGSITFKTWNVDINSNEQTSYPELEPGHFLGLSVADTGMGMEQEVLDRIFEPFFTTKEAGKGTGLGLAGVYGCVRSHHGAVRVSSEIGRGTFFEIFLPLSETEPMEADASDPRKDKEPADVKGHILIVDDDEMVRSVTQRSLKRLGYEVSTCEDGLQAIDYFMRNKDHISMVILDLVMPNMDGADVFRELRRIDPHIPVVVSSGFSDDVKADRLLEKGAVGLLAKPFHGEDLARMVKQHLPPDAA
jgi:PAS domain S-box-containing protein